MLIHNQNFEPYISADTLSKQIDRIANQINQDFADSKDAPLIVITLCGALIFGSDLVRRLDFITDLAFVKCSSYGDSMSPSDYIRYELPPTISPLGRDVIIVEDIVDTGNTYLALHRHLTEMGAKSIRIATMLFKKDVYKKLLPIHYVAMEIDTIFVVGSGLDYNQLGRNLNGIYRLTK